MAHQDVLYSRPEESCQLHLFCQFPGSTEQIPLFCLCGPWGEVTRHSTEEQKAFSSVLVGRNRRKWAYFSCPVESLERREERCWNPEVSHFAYGSGRDLGCPEGPAHPISNSRVTAGEGWVGNSLCGICHQQCLAGPDLPLMLYLDI